MLILKTEYITIEIFNTSKSEITHFKKILSVIMSTANITVDYLPSPKSGIRNRESKMSCGLIANSLYLHEQNISQLKSRCNEKVVKHFPREIFTFCLINCSTKLLNTILSKSVASLKFIINRFN